MTETGATSWPGGHSSDSLSRIVSAFPASLRNDVVSVFSMLPPATYEVIPWDIGRVHLGREAIHIPMRVNFPEPDPTVVSSLPSRQQLILRAVFTRHHDGYVRQHHVAEIIPSAEPWVVPFVLQLLGEYVIEIIELIGHHCSCLKQPVYHQFIAENQQFAALTCDRILSYWDAYFRMRSPRFADHVAYRIAKDIGLWQRPLPAPPRAPE